MSIHRYFFLSTSRPAVGITVQVVDFDGTKYDAKVVHHTSRHSAHFIAELNGDPEKKVWVDSVAKLPSEDDHKAALAADHAELLKRNASRKKGPPSEVDLLKNQLASQAGELAEAKKDIAELKAAVAAAKK